LIVQKLNIRFILQAEGRVLDFNECSTPARKKEDKKMDIVGSASSPVASSYLRMNVR
jgi:myb proto-oncogene protein